MPAALPMQVSMHGTPAWRDGRITPMQPLNSLDRDKERLISLWERSVTTLGIHTVHFTTPSALRAELAELGLLPARSTLPSR